MCLMDWFLSGVADMSALGVTMKDEFYVGLLTLVNQSKIYGSFNDTKMYVFSHNKVAIYVVHRTLFKSIEE